MKIKVSVRKPVLHAIMTSKIHKIFSSLKKEKRTQNISTLFLKIKKVVESPLKKIKKTLLKLNYKFINLSEDNKRRKKFKTYLVCSVSKNRFKR